MAAQQTERFEDLPLKTKFKIIEALSLYPALTLMVFIRRKIGFRMLKPIWFIILTVILLLVPVVFPNGATPFPSAIVIYAIAMLGLGTFQRHKRWHELCQGERWHSYSGGVSYLESLKLPVFLFGNRRLYRFIEPTLCIVAGFILVFLSKALGLWVMIAGLALFIHEQSLYERLLERDLDILDGLISAEVQGEVAARYSNPQTQGDQKPPALEETAGIPTGVAPDIQKQVESRRRKRAAAPDNLVVETPPAAPA